MPSTNQFHHPKAFRKRATAFVLAIAAVTGVYAMFGAYGNAPIITAPAVAGEAKAAVLDRSLSKGAMAAFVFKKDRKALKEIAFKNADGEQLTLGAWKGRVALVNLWATWCAPCRKEMPDLAKLQKDYGGEDFEVVAISVDFKGADASSKFLKSIEGGENLSLYVDKSTRAMKLLGAIGLPLTVLVDREGREVGRLAGPAHWTADEARKIIEAAIAEKPAG